MSAPASTSGFSLMTLFTLLLLSTLVLASLEGALAEEEEEETNVNVPRVTRSQANASPGMLTADIFFLITYQDLDNNAPEKVLVVFSGKSYNMKELDAGDLNFSDGKEYFYELENVQPGNYWYYYSVDDGTFNSTTKSNPLRVEDEVEWHFDIALGMSILVIPVAFIIYYLKKLNDNMKQLSENMVQFLAVREGEPPAPPQQSPIVSSPPEDSGR